MLGACVHVGGMGGRAGRWMGWVGEWGVDGWMGGWVGGWVGGWLAGWLAGVSASVHEPPFPPSLRPDPTAFTLKLVRVYAPPFTLLKTPSFTLKHSNSAAIHT